MNDAISEEPPIRRFLSKIIRPFRRWGKRLMPAKKFVKQGTFFGKPVFWVPTLLVITAVFGNLSESKTHAQTISDLVALDPKTKVAAMTAIDPYTPFVEEAKDADRVITGDVVPSDLVLAKPNLTKTETRPADQPKEPEKRDAVVYHTVSSGETLSEIATSYGLKVASIKVDNPTLVNSDKLTIGDQIKIPAADYSDDYINKHSKTVVATTAGTTSNRKVAVRDTSNDRYEDSGMPAFARPAGARGQNGYHDWAIDIPPSGGKTVKAAADGVVVEVASGWNGGYGNKIVIDHGSGWETLYGHLSVVEISAGQRVSQGQEIGIMGATGRTYPVGAVHLHFEIRKNGTRLNPINYIQ